MSTTPSLAGSTIPTTKYMNSISESFPTINRVYKVDASIDHKHESDHLPSNANLRDLSISDNFIEFLIPPTQELTDCDSIVLEMVLKLTKADGTSIDFDSTPVSVIDNLGQRILLTSAVFLNGVQVESNGHYGIYNAIKTYLSMGKNDLDTIGRNLCCRDSYDKIVPTFTAANVKDPGNREQSVINACKNEIHLMIPIKMDIATSDFYLLNSVAIRMRYQLAPPELVINTPSNEPIKYNIQYAKLMITKYVPNPSALLALNRNLNSNFKTVNYIHERPIIKQFIMPQNHTTLVMEDIFHGIIPHKIYMFLLKQANANGEFTRNGAYFENCGLKTVTLEINSMIHSSLNISFPIRFANALNHTLSNLRSANHLITYENFKEGRSIFCWDLSTTDCDDVLEVEKSGNLRISLHTHNPLPENTYIYIVGVTNGLIQIDGSRRVKTSYLM